MPAFVLLPASPSDLESIVRLQFKACADDQGFPVIFPKGASLSSITHLVHSYENDMENDPTCFIMIVKEAMSGEIVSYAVWHFYPPRSQEEIDLEMLVENIPLPIDANQELGNRLIRESTRKRHEVVAATIGPQRAYASPNAAESAGNGSLLDDVEESPFPSSTYPDIPNPVSNASLWQQLLGLGTPAGDMFLENLASEWAKVMPNNQNTENSRRPTESCDTVVVATEATDRRDEKAVAARGRNLIGSWRGSPIRLLNSSVELLLLNQSLGEIYECMMSGIAIRYLDYNCNLFAGSYRYSFDADCPEPAISEQESTKTLATTYTAAWKQKTPSSSMNPRIQSKLSLEILSSQINKVTMIGIARFLDNFGSLYGNIIDAKARKQNERTLTAVLQAFALQFGPCRQDKESRDHQPNPFETAGHVSSLDTSLEASTSTNTPMFITAWLNAYAFLAEPQQCRSFLRLYAVFLFMMTTMPSEAQVDGRVHVDALDILDDALRQMLELRELIDSYCSHLDNMSIYKFLFQSSFGIFGWYAYLRDTIASVLNPRTFILDDAPLPLKGT
ncbi:hypothetical protein LTS17_004947 [Exophiala oligosperma]